MTAGPVPDRVLRDVLDPVPPAWDERPGMRLAAVLAAWFTRDGSDHLLYIRRRDDLPSHPGQIAFPGGAREGTESPLATALRESHEEVGLEPGAVQVLGSLPARTSISGFWVHALVARIPPDLALVADPGEVAAILEFPVARLADADAWDHRPPAGAPTRRPTAHFEHDGETLWGLTAVFTRDLLQRVSAARD